MGNYFQNWLPPHRACSHAFFFAPRRFPWTTKPHEMFTILTSRYLSPHPGSRLCKHVYAVFVSETPADVMTWMMAQIVEAVPSALTFVEFRRGDEQAHPA